MFAKLLLLFTIIPIIELSLLVTLGDKIGLWPTVVIIAATGIGGALLGKYQGLSAWRRIKEEMNSGTLPKDALLDGLAVVIASAFLVTPGVLTDFAGFSLLIPWTRKPIKYFVFKRLDTYLKKENKGLFGFYHGSDIYDEPPDMSSNPYPTPHASDMVIDVTPEQSN